MAAKRLHSPSGGDTPLKMTRTSPLKKALYMQNEVGIIESVTLKHFMCHDHLDINFGPGVNFEPRINFIHGKNGSGKSAILAAIIVGLGGRANDTGRGKNLSGYVKTGKQVAEISVTLHNCGMDAYKPELYGSSITIVRRMTVSGTSSYKIKSENGEVISTKKNDLISILDNFNIQINNPISVLNQEESRIFLSTTGGKEKYKFFFRATQLEQMREDYGSSREERAMTEAILEKKKKNLPKLEKDVGYWEKKWKIFQALEKEHEKMEKLKNEFAWAYIMALEKDASEKEEELENMKRIAAGFRNKVEENEIDLTKVKKEREEKFKKLKKIDQEIEEFHLKLDNAKNMLEKQKQMLRKNEFNLQRLKRRILDEFKEIKGLQDKIEEIKNGGQADNAAEKMKIEKEIEKQEHLVNRLKAEHKTTEVYSRNMEASLMKYKEELHHLRQREKDLYGCIEKMKQSVRHLEFSRTNSLRRYGRFIPELLEQIEINYRRGKFSQKPKGPIGSYVKLKESKWALAVESCLNKLLLSFCCDNYQDQQVLQQIMKDVMKNEKKPSVITSKFTNQVYDTRKFAVQSSEYCTILDILQCEDPVIINSLIDQRNIEQILLIESNSEARQAMLNSAPKNCRGAYTLEGDQILLSPCFRNYACQKQKVEYLQGTVDGQIKEFQAEMKEVESTLREVQGQISEKKDILQSNQKEMHVSEKRIGELCQSINQCNLRLDELRSCQDTEAIDVRVLEEEVLVLEENKCKDEKMALEKQKEYEDDKQLCEEKLKETHRLNAEISSLWKICEPYKNQLNQLDDEMKNIKFNKQRHEAQLNECLRNVASFEIRHTEALKTLKEETIKAEEISPRINTCRTPHSIEEEIRLLEQNLSEQEKNQSSKEEVEAKYFECKKKFLEVQKDINNISEYLTKLTDLLKCRQNSFIQMRNQLSVRIKFLFKNLLSFRRYIGKVVFDHENETLEIKVKPSVALEKVNGDMGSLSGGERSFTTVSFMLALWDCVESPFRILDEFEVYMDMVNRRVTLDLIIDTCSVKKKTQVILLSPLEFPPKMSTQNVVIHEMPEPPRSKNQMPSN